MKPRRNAVVLALIAVATTMCTPFFALEAVAKDKGGEAAVRAAELARFKANVDSDAKTLRLLLADDLDDVHSNGDIDTNTSFIESLTAGWRGSVSKEPVIQQVLFFGQLAIVRGTAPAP